MKVHEGHAVLDRYIKHLDSYVKQTATKTKESTHSTLREIDEESTDAYVAGMLDEKSKTDLRKELGHRLREGRAAKGWTLRQAAAETGISNGYLSLIEHGAVKAPSPRYLMAMAEGYGLPYDELMELAGHPSGPVPISAGGSPTPAAERATPAGTAPGRASGFAGREWSRSSLTGVFGTGGRAERVGPPDRRDDREASDDRDEDGRADPAEPSAGPPRGRSTGRPTDDELTDDEREQLMALVIDDMRGLTPSDIANVRAFIAGVRATRRR